jgi:hypothetical protein
MKTALLFCFSSFFGIVNAMIINPEKYLSVSPNISPRVVAFVMGFATFMGLTLAIMVTTVRREEYSKKFRAACCLCVIFDIYAWVSMTLGSLGIVKP